MTDSGFLAAVCASSKEASSPELAALFIDRAQFDYLERWRIPTEPEPHDIERLVAKHGYRLAVKFAHSTENPRVLAVLAKRSSVQVLRAVVGNIHTDQPTLRALWPAALRTKDEELLCQLISCVDPLSVADVFDVRGLKQTFYYPDYFRPRTGTSAVPWCDQSGVFVAGSAAFRVLREASDEVRAEAVPPLLESEHVRAALEAAAMCAAGVVPGVSAVDAFNRFVAARPDTLPTQPRYNRRVSSAVACLRHMALCGDVTIGADLAELLCAHADALVDTAPFTSQSCYTVPLFGARVTSEAFDMFRRPNAEHPASARSVAALIDESWLSRPAEQMLDLAAAGAVAPGTVFRLLQTAPQHFSSPLLNRALRLCCLDTAAFKLLRELDSSYVLDDDLLVWLAQSAPEADLAAFLSGELPVKPTPDVVSQLFAADAVDHRVRQRTVLCFSVWVDQPWSAALLSGLGPAVFEVTKRDTAEAVVSMFHAAFGENIEQWRLAFDLLDQDFPGSLTDLLSMVRSLASAPTPATAT